MDQFWDSSDALARGSLRKFPLSPHKPLQVDEGIGQGTQALDVADERQPLPPHHETIGREIATGTRRPDDHNDIGSPIGVQVAEHETVQSAISRPDRTGNEIVIRPGSVKSGIEPKGVAADAARLT